MYEEIDLGDISPIGVPYRIGGKQYVLKEAMADVVVKYQQESGGNMGEKAYSFLSECIFEVTPEGERNVPLSVVKSLPFRIFRPLFEKLAEISGMMPVESAETLQKRIEADQEKLSKLLNGTAESPSKNSLPATTVGSA